MAYFIHADSGKHYVALFFSRQRNDSYSGKLLTLSRWGTRFTLMLPVLATAMAISTVLELTSFFSHQLFPAAQAMRYAFLVNWGQMIVSLAIAVSTGMIVCHSQLHAVKHDDYFRPRGDAAFRIDWKRSLPMFMIMVLFAVNGMLFTLWVNGSPEQGEEYGHMDHPWRVLFLFSLPLVPGACRLAWLFGQRKADTVAWR